MRESHNGKTVGMTLRLEKDILAVFQKIASAENLKLIQGGKTGNVSAQDIIRRALKDEAKKMVCERER